MGGLAHQIENAGIATTQISLYRLHTETMQPPRALWVPFALGRPFGGAEQADFQRRVVLDALRLLERDSGPILEDFPDDEPPSAGEESGWVCPLNLARKDEELTGIAALEAALKAEVEQLLPWYDRAVAARGRTTFGVSNLDIKDIATLLTSMCGEQSSNSPNPELSLADAIRLSAEDLKAFYLEAISAQPGDASHAQLNEWFWNNTVAADVLRQLKERCLASEDESINLLGVVLLVPVAHANAAVNA